MGRGRENSRRQKEMERHNKQLYNLFQVGMEKESKSIGLKKEDAKNRVRWRVGVVAGRVG